MKVKILKPLWYKGKTFYPDEVVDMEDDMVKAFGKKYVQPLRSEKNDSHTGGSKRVSKNK